MTIRTGARAHRRSPRRSRPSPSRVTVKVSPLGRMQTSSRSFDTSIPMNTSISRPCTCGLAMRPRRLFGMLGWADGAPGSGTGFETQGAEGLPSAAATSTLSPCRNDEEIQGVYLGYTHGIRSRTPSRAARYGSQVAVEEGSLLPLGLIDDRTRPALNKRVWPTMGDAQKCARPTPPAPDQAAARTYGRWKCANRGRSQRRLNGPVGPLATV